MPNDNTNRGQEKSHPIFNADGTPVLNEDGSQRMMTQAEWRERDKSLGYTRAEDEEESVEDETEAVG